MAQDNGNLSEAPTRQSEGLGAVSATKGGLIQSGDVIQDRYEIERELGHGGIGAVYMARDLRLMSKPVVVKVLLEGVNQDLWFRKKFQQEMEALARIDHPGVVGVLDHGEMPDGKPFLVIQFIEGSNLRTIIDRHGTDLDRTAHIIRQVSHALTAAHEKGIVHRDLKPENVMLQKVEEGEVVKLIDFGIATVKDSQAATTRDTTTIVGSLAYMAPEQLMGKPVYQSDIYALGVMAYELVTGRIPFATTAPAKLYTMQQSGVQAKPKLLRDELPESAQDVILRALEFEPEKRYPRARDLGDELYRALTSLANDEREGSIVSSRQVFKKKWTAWAIATTILTGVTIGGTAVYHWVPSVHARFSNSPSHVGTLPCTGIPSLSEGEYLAVAPFQASGDESLSHLSDSVFEKLSTKFYNVPRIRVISDVEGVGKTNPIQKAGCELGANLIVNGTINEVGDNIKVNVRLDNVKSNKPILDENLTRSKKEVFALVDDISSKISNVLTSKVAAPRSPPEAPPTQDVDAYYLYLQGVHALRDRDDDGRFQEAFKFHNDALRRDPGFALAYAGLADAYEAKYEGTKVEDWANRAVYSAEKAVKLDSKLPEAQLALGTAYTVVGKTEFAIDTLKDVLRLRPNSDDTYRRLGTAYLACGRKPDAIAAYRKAVEVNNFYWNNHYQLGQAYLRYGNTGEALKEFQKVIELASDKAIGYEAVADVYFSQADYQNCTAQYEKALAIEPSYSTYSNLGSAYIYLKRYNEATSKLEQAVKMNPADYTAHGNLADAYRWSNEAAKADAEYSEATRLALKRLTMNPRDPSALGDIAVYYARRQKFSLALDSIQRARTIDRNDPQLIYDAALIETIRGDAKKAIQMFSESVRKGYSAKMLENDPELDQMKRRFSADFAALTKASSEKSR